MKEQELKLKAFLDKCTCRNGMTPTITGIEKNAGGMVVSVKGTVDGKDMYWNAMGNVAGNDALLYDLVETVQVGDLGV
jgi:hypothetical protein